MGTITHRNWSFDSCPSSGTNGPDKFKFPRALKEKHIREAKVTTAILNSAGQNGKHHLLQSNLISFTWRNRKLRYVTNFRWPNLCSKGSGHRRLKQIVGRTSCALESRPHIRWTNPSISHETWIQLELQGSAGPAQFVRLPPLLNFLFQLKRTVPEIPFKTLIKRKTAKYNATSSHKKWHRQEWLAQEFTRASASHSSSSKEKWASN